MNSLFNLLGGGGNPFQGTPFGNMMNFMTSFNQFRQGFTGDPRQQVQNLINSGRITQEQYNNAVNLANEASKLLRRF